MKDLIQKISQSNFIQNHLFQHIIIAVVIVIFTWPDHNAAFLPNLDGSYFAIFNWFAAYDISVLKTVNFTFGPLGFLKNTVAVGDNVIWGNLLTFISRTGFLIFLFDFTWRKNSLLLTGLFGYLFCCFFNMDFFLYGLTMISILHFKRFENPWILSIPIFLISLGLLIKVNIGLNIILIYGSWLIYHSLTKNDYKFFFINSIAIVATYFILWMIIFQGLEGSLDLIYGYIAYVLTNSDSVSIFPPNSALALTFLFMCITLIYYLGIKEKQTRPIFVSTLLFLIATFKYSFGRQAGNHSGEFLLLLFFLAFFLLIELNRKLKVQYILIFLAVFFYEYNLSVNGTFSGNKRYVPYIGGSNFISQVIRYDTYKSKWEKESIKNLEHTRLPNDWLKEIGDQRIDFFPWELTYFIPNDLNYHPRPGLMFGGFPKPITKKNIEFLRGENAPEYIIWEKWKYTGQVGGIDKQYLFNTDGSFVREILSRYQVIKARKRDLLLKRRSPKYITEEIGNESLDWGKPIELPVLDSTQAMFLKLDVDYNIKGWLLDKFYKTRRAEIEYRFENGNTHKYEITRLAMEEGIWVQPYIDKVNTELIGQRVKSIIISQPEECCIFKDRFKVNWFVFKEN